MKIKKEHYDILKTGIDAILPYMQSWSKYKELGLSRQRYRWDVFHVATTTNDVNGQRPIPKNFVSNILYKYLNDSHIEMALKSIMPDSTLD